MEARPSISFALRSPPWSLRALGDLLAIQVDGQVVLFDKSGVTRETGLMKNYTKILFSILAAAICSAGFAAEPQSCKKTGKNCPMNDNKKCNCGKNCSC